MLRRLFQAWRIGTGRIKFVLEKDVWKQGEVIHGDLHVTGGSEPLQFLRVELMMTLITMRGREYTRSLLTVLDMQNIELRKGEKTTIVFSKQLPEAIAISSTHIMYSIRLCSGVREEIKFIDIVPNEPFKQVINALYNLDFRRDPSFGCFDGRIQNFVFVPVGYFMRMLVFVSFHVVQRGNEIRLLMHICDNEHHDLFHVAKFLHWEWNEIELLTERLRKEMTDMCNEPDSYLKKLNWIEEGAVGSVADGLFPKSI